MSRKGKEKVGEPSSGKTFRLQTTQLYMTYAQCAIEPKVVLEVLKETMAKRKRTIEEYIVAQEKHQDGNFHIHCWLKLNKQIEISSPRLLDVKEHHGKYEAVRNPTKCKKYCTKDGVYISDPPYIPPVKVTTWTTAIAQMEAGMTQEAMETLKSGGDRTCRDLILHRTAILTAMTDLKPVVCLQSARELTSYEPLFEWDRRRTLILFGETNTGKTELATSLIPKALMTSHMDILANLREGHEGIILDDMSFKHLHDEAQIALLDTAFERQIHIRYKVAILPAGLPRIITTNKEPFEIVNTNNPAILRRIQCIRWLGYNKDPAWVEGF